MGYIVVERLVEVLRPHERGRQAALATYCGVSAATVSDWVRGKTQTMKGEHLSRAAEFLDVNPDWLIGLSNSRQRLTRAASSALSDATATLQPLLAWEFADELPYGEFVLVPRLNIRLSGGPGSINGIELDFVKSTPQAFRAEWIRQMRLRPNKLAAMTSRGDSMADRILDGDSLLVDTSQTEVRDGRVYALWYAGDGGDGGERVKRLYTLPDSGLLIRSDNVKYPEIRLAPEHATSVRVIGRVMALGGTNGL